MVRILSPLKSQTAIRKRRAFTLAELIIVITLVAMFSIVALTTLGTNDQTKSKTTKERIRTDLSQLRKQSLLRKQSTGFIEFAEGENGYLISLSSDIRDRLNLLAAEPLSSAPSYSFSFHTEQFNVNTNHYEDTTFNPAIKFMYRNTRQEVQSFDIPYDGTRVNFNVEISGPSLDSSLVFYCQNPDNPKIRTNELEYMFYRSDNIDQNDKNDYKIIDIDDNLNDNINGVYTALRASFDGFGKPTVETKTEANPDWSKNTNSPITLILHADNATSAPDTFTIPDDL